MHACSELRRDGIDTAHVLRAEGHPSPFTYIIVDRTGAGVATGLAEGFRGGWRGTRARV